MHDHAHHHQHFPARGGRFAVGAGLNGAFVILEIVAGLSVGSVALLADAGHNAGDVAALLMTWAAAAAGRVAPSPRWTYGLRRSSVLVALMNAGLLLISIGAIGWEAIRRLMWPQPVAGGIIMIVAGAGIIINGITTLLFAAGRKGDINIEAAFLHNVADTAISVVVLLAGLLIRRTHWLWIDPAAGLLIVAVLIRSTWSLLARSAALAMDAVPAGIDPAAVRQLLCQAAGVQAVHDLHIWAMSTTETALTAHVVRPAAEGDDDFLLRTARALHDQFGIEHVTIQIERQSTAAQCAQMPDTAV